MLQYNHDFFEDRESIDISFLRQSCVNVLAHREELMQRYSRKEDANTLMSSDTERILTSFERYIANIVKGHFAGKPPIFEFSLPRGEQPTARMDDSQLNAVNEELKQIQEEYKWYLEPTIEQYKEAFVTAIHDYSVVGAGYIHIHQDEKGFIVVTPGNALNTVVIYDFSPNPEPIAYVRIWADAEGEQFLELTLRDERRLYNGSNEQTPFLEYDLEGNYTKVMYKALEWGYLPIIPFEDMNGIAVFEPALEHIDAFEELMYRVLQMARQGSKLRGVFKGLTPENERMVYNEDGEQVLNPLFDQEMGGLDDQRWFFLPYDDAGLDFKNPSLDFGSMLEYLQYLEELIVTLCFTPDMSDKQFAGNTSGRSLGYKMFALSQYKTYTERIAREATARLMKIVTRRINKNTGTSFDYRTVSIKFPPNQPEDETAQMERGQRAYLTGFLPHKKSLEIAGIDPYEPEILAFIKEQEELMGQERGIEIRKIMR